MMIKNCPLKYLKLPLVCDNVVDNEGYNIVGENRRMKIK